MTQEEIYNQLPNDFFELIIIGQDYAKKNPLLNESKIFREMMEKETADLIEFKVQVSEIIYKSKTL